MIIETHDLPKTRVSPYVSTQQLVLITMNVDTRFYPLDRTASLSLILRPHTIFGSDYECGYQGSIPQIVPPDCHHKPIPYMVPTGPIPQIVPPHCHYKPMFTHHIWFRYVLSPRSYRLIVTTTLCPHTIFGSEYCQYYICCCLHIKTFFFFFPTYMSSTPSVHPESSSYEIQILWSQIVRNIYKKKIIIANYSRQVRRPIEF